MTVFCTLTTQNAPKLADQSSLNIAIGRQRRAAAPHSVRYGEVRRVLSGTKGRNERTYGLGGAPVVIVHGNQRHELA
jgi:hypothetical protein